VRIHQGFEEKSRLGRLLINRGYLSERQVEQALKAQRESGQRLGEVLVGAGWVTEKELQRVLKHQSRYRNAAALVAMVTLPLQPMVSFASSSTNATSEAQQASELYAKNGFAPMSDADMADVSAQSGLGLLEGIETVAAMAGQAGNIREGIEAAGIPEQDAVEGLKLAANVFVPVLNFLDSDMSISGVHYREGEPRYSVREDGALTLAFPERIEEIRMDNIRVSGGHTPSMGNVSIRDIRFHPGSKMTIYTR